MNLPKSLNMLKRATQRIPGMTQLLSKRPDMFAPVVWPGYFSKANGADAVTLPLYPGLTEAEQSHVFSTLSKALGCC